MATAVLDRCCQKPALDPRRYYLARHVRADAGFFPLSLPMWRARSALSKCCK